MSDEPDRIVVRKEKLVRCLWCGSPQSNDWVVSEKGEIFCTRECKLAANVRKTWQTSIAMLSCSVMIIIPITFILVFINIRIAPMAFPILLYAFLMLFASIAGFVYSYEGRKYQDRKGKYPGTPPIECEYCRHSNPPSVTRCLNCDATLTRAPFVSEEIPPWIHKQKRVSGVKCPHCNAVYAYLPSMISDEGNVACQNCNQQFSVSRKSMDTSPERKRVHY
ncbi:MAG: hypothetical protein ACTSW8_05785 [Candidatus Thorarchaeota archaeon]